MSGDVETREFQAEAKQVLDLMVHAIYSNRDIFLRELISNASDALDRRRFEAVSNPALLDPGTELHILIERDEDARTVTVRDNGIGMSRDEVHNLIGTIAKSGTRQFLAALKEAKDSAVPPELIGQFGVGFYSCFMVADRVTMVTRRAGEASGTRWESSGEGSYTVADADDAEVGTAVTVHIKEPEEGDDMPEYTKEWKVREIVKKYSDFVAYPIKMEVERTEVERDDDGKPKDGAKPMTVRELQTLNSMKAIWLRDKSELTDNDLNEFYKHVAHDWTDPLHVIQAKIEGTLEYRLLLFIPSRAPFDLYLRDGSHGIHLYVKRIFIMDDCKVLLPEYLRFMRGVVDSEDLSLNISREMLQQNRQIERMRKGIANKVLDSLKQLAESEEEKYLAFWREFGPVLKEGLYGDPERRDALLELLRFESTDSPGALTTLQSYVDRMRDSQDAIYYMTGESRAAVEHSPHLEAFREKGCEVLILTDAVDEIWTQSVFEYKGKRFQSVGKGTVDLGTEEEKQKAEEERKEKAETHASLMECLKNKLDEYVKEVRLSSRLTTSAACLVGDPGDLSPQLEALLRASKQDIPKTKRILELNPSHPILAKLKAVYDADNKDPRLDDYAQLLYGQALLAEGGQPPDPGAFSRLVTEVMVKAL